MRSKYFLVIMFIIIAALGAYYVMNHTKTSQESSSESNLLDLMVGQKPASGGITEYDYTGEYGGRVDWEAGIIVVQAAGPAQSSDEARTTGPKIARMKALSKLAEFVDKVRITSSSTLVDERSLNSQLSNSVEAFVRGAVETKVQFLKLPSGSEQALVTLQLDLYGPLGLKELMRKERPATGKQDPTAISPKTSVAKKPEPPSETKTTPAPAETKPPDKVGENPVFTAGLVIDARGLGLMPAVFPRIITESGETLYDYSKVHPEVATQRSVVSYRASLEGVKALEGFGGNPLVIKAVNLAGPLKADVIVSDADAKLIASHSANHRTDNQALVAFLISSLDK